MEGARSGVAEKDCQVGEVEERAGVDIEKGKNLGEAWVS